MLSQRFFECFRLDLALEPPTAPLALPPPVPHDLLAFRIVILSGLFCVTRPSLLVPILWLVCGTSVLQQLEGFTFLMTAEYAVKPKKQKNFRTVHHAGDGGWGLSHPPWSGRYLQSLDCAGNERTCLTVDGCLRLKRLRIGGNPPTCARAPANCSHVPKGNRKNHPPPARLTATSLFALRASATLERLCLARAR